MRFDEVTPELCEALEGRTIVEVRVGPEPTVAPWLVLEMDDGSVWYLLDGWGNCPILERDG